MIHGYAKVTEDMAQLWAPPIGIAGFIPHKLSAQLQEMLAIIYKFDIKAAH